MNRTDKVRTSIKNWLIAFSFELYLHREKDAQFTCHDNYSDDKCIYIEQKRQRKER